MHSALTAGADVWISVRLDPKVKKAIADITADAWTKITNPHPIFDRPHSSGCPGPESPRSHTAFSCKKKAKRVTGRLMVRRIPDANAERNKAAGQDTLFDVWHFHAFFTTSDPDLLDTVAADEAHLRLIT